MNSNPNHSRIGLHLGDPIDGNEKASLKATLSFGKGAADLQTEKLKTLIGAEDPNLSLVLVLTPAPGKHSELEETLKRLLEGKDQGNLARDISVPFRDGIAAYNISHSGSNLILQIKLGPSVAEMASQQVGMILGMGVEDLASTERATININLLSGINFYDLIEHHKKGYTTIAALWRSFIAELIVQSVAGSQLDTKLMDMIQAFIPHLSSTPLPLLKFLKHVDVDFSFKSTDELPASFKKEFVDDNHLIQFPRVPKDQKESPECKLFETLTDVLQASVDAYITIEKVAAIHVEVRAPGFGVCLTTVQEPTI